jgi:hypothetical protein
MVTLTQEEKAALVTLGKMQRRDPREEAAVLIRRGLTEYGLIALDPLINLPLDFEDPERGTELLQHG